MLIEKLPSESVERERSISTCRGLSTGMRGSMSAYTSSSYEWKGICTGSAWTKHRLWEDTSHNLRKIKNMKKEYNEQA